MTIGDLVLGPSLLTQKRFLLPFLEIYGVIALAFVSASFLLGKVLSHRTAGPIYAFEKYLNDMLDGKQPKKLKLRAGDEFKHLEELANRLGDHFDGTPSRPLRKTRDESA
jgi:signal peptidase II